MNIDGLIIIFVITLACYTIYLQTKLSRRHADGHIVITEDEDGKKMFTLELDKNPDEIASMDYILFKVTGEATEELE